MALNQLLLTRRIKQTETELEAVRAKGADISSREEQLHTREAELEAAINELPDDASIEDRAALDELVTEHQNDAAALEKEKGEHAEEEQRLTDELDKLDKEFKQTKERAKIPATEHRKDEKAMDERELRLHSRNKFGKPLEELIQREDVNAFLTRMKEMKGQTRSVSGTELFIPDVLLGLLRDNMNRYSKLLAYVDVRNVRGQSRLNIAGGIPEGVWTEMCASLNELEFGFNQVELDGYKVGGFIAICNAVLEDSTLNLASEILDKIGQAIGYALDKAILYGTDIKMPLGIMTRLAQTAKPSDWPATAPAWADLHQSHILEIDPADFGSDYARFFANLMLYMLVARRNYSTGNKFWAMNENTWNKLVSMTVQFNAAGALVASQNATMPLVGGPVVLLDFIPEGDIIGGYGSLYLVAERQGGEFASSEHTRFLQDQTVFKGTARYDGAPVFGEAFVAINIQGAAVTTSIPFAPDNANILPPPMALPMAGDYTDGVSVYLVSTNPVAKIKYTTDGSEPTKDKGTTYKGAPIALTATTTIKAIALAEGAEPSPVTTAEYTIA